MTLGILSSAYLPPLARGKEQEVKAAIRRARSHGYQALDLQDTLADDSPIFSLSPSELHTYRTLFEEEGILLYQSHGPWRFPPRDDTEANRNERLERMTQSLQIAAALGIPHTVIHPLMPFGPDTAAHTEEMIDINRAFARTLASRAVLYGVTLCYENMPFPHLPITTPSQIAAFVRETHPALRVCLDTGHAGCLGVSPAEAVYQIGSSLLACLHIHENDGLRDAHLPLGSGNVNWSAFAKALNDIGYRGSLCLEASVPSSLPEAQKEPAQIAHAREAAARLQIPL